MRIQNIEFSNIRVFEKYQCEFHPGINLISGKNGKGKTTILEAINILSLGKSFKSGLKKNIIRTGEEGFSIKGKLFDQNEHLTSIRVNFYKDKQKILIDGVPARSALELVGKFPVVIMSPEDIDIINGGAGTRRSFFNRIFSIVDRKYLLNLREYNRILEHRRATLIKNDLRSLDVWSEKLAESGILLWQKRKEYLKQYSEIFSRCWRSDFSNAAAHMKLEEKAASSQDEFIRKLAKVRDREIYQKSNLFGPHKDDFHFYYNDRTVKHFASQGEKKTVLTAIKHAESVFIRDYLQRPPVLLLDDLFAKLDSSRGLKTIRLLGGQFQTIITSTDQNIPELQEMEKNSIQYIYLN